MDDELCRRIEIVDGRPAFMASPGYDHQIMVGHLWVALRRKLPDGYAVATGLDVQLRDRPLLLRRPDVIAFRKDGPGGKPPLRADNVVLAIEVVSPGSVMVDRVDKPAEYAAAGIPHFWRLEQGSGPTLFVYGRARSGGGYGHPVSFDVKYVASEPFAIDIDMQALTVE